MDFTNIQSATDSEVGAVQPTPAAKATVKPTPQPSEDPDNPFPPPDFPAPAF